MSQPVFTQAYIDSVAKRLNVEPDLPLNVDKNTFDLLRAINIHENGVIYDYFYNDNVIEDGNFIISTF